MIKKFCLILTLVIFSTLKSVYAEEIKVGVMLHLGGDFAAWGQAYLEGAQLAQEQVNANGGIKGRKLGLIVEDIRFDPRMTASATKKLLEVDHVPVAIISTFTEVMVAGPAFERAKVPLVVIGDSGEELDAMGNYVFSTGSWVKGYAVSASNYFTKKLHLKKIAVIATNNPWSQTTADTFTKDFQAQGGTVAFREATLKSPIFEVCLEILKARAWTGFSRQSLPIRFPFLNKQAT